MNVDSNIDGVGEKLLSFAEAQESVPKSPDLLTRKRSIFSDRITIEADEYYSRNNIKSFNYTNVPDHIVKEKESLLQGFEFQKNLLAGKFDSILLSPTTTVRSTAQIISDFFFCHYRYYRGYWEGCIWPHFWPIYDVFVKIRLTIYFFFKDIIDPIIYFTAHNIFPVVDFYETYIMGCYFAYVTLALI